MISHTVSERYLADAWKELICQAFGLGDDSVWFSSDSAAVGARRPFLQYIEESIRHAEAIISIQSPISRFRPWILLEAGMALALKKPVYVIVYEPSKTTKQDSIVGKLETPLDAFQQFRGSDLKDVKESILTLLQADLGRSIHVARLDDALSKYKQAIEPWEYCWTSETKNFENRIRLVLQVEERRGLAEKGTVADTVEVQGDRDSMILFDLLVDRIRWREFINHLEKLKSPWPGSAARWASCLGGALQRALNGLCLEGPEGLPLYFDSRKRQSYRPAVTLQRNCGGETCFDISFTLLPPELTIRPNTKVGILLHHLDFCRMMRWGVLEDPQLAVFFRNPERVMKDKRFSVFIRKPHLVRTEQVAERMRDFLGRLYSIRTEFLNRGLEKDSIFEAIDPVDQPKLKSEVDGYYLAIGKIDPDDKGILPDPLPDIEVLRQVYSELLRFNKELYRLLHKALGQEIGKLVGSIDDL